MTPLGMEGTKPISQILADAKLSQAARVRLPVVYDMIGPIWVPGICIADRVRIDPGTRAAIRLEFAPISGVKEP
jgi:tRNA(Ile)-lysidine synthase